MARLEAEESDAGARLDRRAAHRAGFAVDPRGDVDAEHGLAGAREGVDRLDATKRRAVEIARQPGAEQGVDDEIGGGEIDRLGGRDRTFPARRRQRRVAAQRRALAEQIEADAVAARAQEPRGDEAVAAVAARPADDGDAAGARRHARRLVGDRRAGALHQRDAGNAAGDGQPVGLAHFGRGQQFAMAAGIEHGGTVAPRPRRGKGRKGIGIRAGRNWRFPSRDFLLYRALALRPDPR